MRITFLAFVSRDEASSWLCATIRVVMKRCSFHLCSVVNMNALYFFLWRKRWIPLHFWRISLRHPLHRLPFSLSDLFLSLAAPHVCTTNPPCGLWRGRDPFFSSFNAACVCLLSVEIKTGFIWFLDLKDPPTHLHSHTHPSSSLPLLRTYWNSLFVLHSGLRAILRFLLAFCAFANPSPVCCRFPSRHRGGLYSILFELA